jgi:hypothetical protein
MSRSWASSARWSRARSAAFCEVAASLAPSNIRPSISNWVVGNQVDADLKRSSSPFVLDLAKLKAEGMSNMRRPSVPHLALRDLFFEAIGAVVGFCVGYVLVLAAVAGFVWMVRH